MSFTQRILLAMLAGITVGVLLNVFGANFQVISDFLVDGLFYVVGAIFIALLKLMVVPLVLVSLVCGVTALGDLRTLGRVGGKTLGLYLVTTAVAITFALTIANVISPGEGFEFAGQEFSYQTREAPPLAEVLIGIFPDNPIRAMADGQMLQSIMFAMLLGFAITSAGERGKRVAALFADLNEVILKMVLLVIKTAPIGVFALISRTFATQGIEIFKPLLG